MKTNILANIRVLAIMTVCLTVLGIGNAWGDATTIYTNAGATGTSSGVTAAGNVNNGNGNPAPSWGNTSSSNRTFITLTGLNVSGYTDVQLTFDYKLAKSGSSYSSFTVSQYNSSDVLIGSATNVTGTNYTSFSSKTINIASNCVKIVFYGSPASSTYGNYVDNISITGTLAPSDPYTVNFNAQGGTCPYAAEFTRTSPSYQIDEASAGAGVTLPHAAPSAACASEGWGFYGWATSAVGSSTTTAPTIVGKAGDTYHPASDNITLHAVYAQGEYTKETSSITSGSKYLIVVNYSSKNYILKSSSADYNTTSHTMASAQINETSSNKYHAAAVNANWCYTIDGSTDNWRIHDVVNATNNYLDIAYTDWWGKAYDSDDPYKITVSAGVWSLNCHYYYNSKYNDAYLSFDETNKLFQAGDDPYSILLYKAGTINYWSNPSCCDKAVAVSYNSAGSTHVSAMTFSAASTATCGGASTRRVTVFVTPTSGYLFKAGDELTWTKSSGTIPADPTLVSGPTLNAGKYEFVYEFAQNDNGAGTFAAAASTLTNYRTVCCTDPGLAYGTGSVTKTFGEGTFTNTLTNSNGVSVSYVSSVPEVATVASDGTVTIVGAGTTTITASCVQQTISSTTYCADEASYTLTVNKASISPTLTYSPNSVAVGDNSSAPSVGGNSGSGGVTYAITSASPAGCATINTSTGVVTGVAVGSVTVTATIAATDNYNGNTATATVSIIAASYFQNGATVFIQADSKDYSAWKDDACVKAWFNASGAGGAAQTTYWLFDATDTDAGKKLFATVVPASGSLNQVTVQRFAEGCGSFLNANGTLTQASSSGVNTFRSYGSADNNIAWNGSSTTLSLYGSQNSWASSLATFTDQGSGVWTASFNNYAPDATSKDYKIKTSYNNGWIGNTGSNNNATLSGMIVGSTYNVTATLDVTDHSLVMSKEFVKGEVSFDLQGHGSAISKLTNVTAGSKISAPSPAPSETGWTFGGWYKEPACTNAWDFANDVVNETMTLYAKWTANVYTITKTLTNVSNTGLPASFTYTGATTTALNSTFTVDATNFFLPSSIAVTMGGTPLTAGTHYTYNNSTGAFTFSAVITGNIVITATATAKLKSIAITTQPTTRKYFAGESFSSTGAVVTATMGDGSTKAVTASATWTPPATPLAAGTGLTVTASYTENAINQTATTTIDVYSVTVNKKNEDGDAVSADGVSAGWTVGTKALAASASGASKYVFKQWEVTGASIGSTSSANTTLSSPTANVVVNAVFYKPRVIKWSVGGDDSYETGSPTTSVAYNGTISAIPTAPNDNALGSCATKFMGWSTKSWGSTTGKDDSDYDDLFTTAGGYTTGITDGTKTFYAVFATASGSDGYAQVTDASTLRAGDKLLITSGTTGTIYVLGYQKVDGKSVMSNRGAISTDVTTGVIDPDIASDNSETTKAFELELQGSTGNWNLYDIANSGYLQANGGTSSNLLTYNTDGDRDNNDTWTISIAGSSPYAASIVTTNGGSGNRGTMRYNSSGLFNCYSSATQDPIYIFKTAVSYSDYVTLCCSLKPVTGLTVSSMTANSVTLSWTAPSPTTGIDHLEVRNASTDAKIGSNIAVGTTTTSVTSLTECNTYSYKIVSVGATCETPSDVIEAQPFSGAKTVTFNYNGGSGTPASFTTSCAGNTVSLPTPDTRAGYTFLGWWSAQNGGAKRGDAGDTYTVTGTTTLWAHWSVINYTVTMAQSPSVGATLTGGTTTANYGNTIDISTDVPSGYRFTGWTADPSVTFADASATSTSFTMPASNVTVTANFVQIHTLTFVVPDGGGSAVTPPATADHGGTVTLPSTTGKDAEFSCETFLGWTTTAPNGSGTWSPAPTYKAAGATSDAINTNTTFYAVYSRSGGGASGTVELPCTVIATWKSDTLGGTSNAYGTVTSVRINNLTWTTTGNIDDAGEVKIKTGYYLKIPTLPGNISTIRMVVSQQNESDACAEYPGNATTKAFYFRSAADGDNLFSSETTSSRSRTITITSGDYTTGYICCTDGTGNIHSVSVDYGPAPIISHTLKCDCAITQFDLTYNANTSYFPGSTTSCSGVDDYKWSEHDDVYTICSTEPTCEGYKFIGWNTQANGSGEDGRLYQPSEEVTCWPEANMTLYARYERVYTVTFNNQGTITSRTQGSAGASVKVPNHTTPCTDDEHEPDEYTWAFAGWSTTPTLSNSLTPNLVLNATTGAYNADYTPTDDITLYAVYQKTTTTSPTFQNGKTGAYKLSAGASYATSKYNNGYYSNTTPPATDPIVYFTYNEAGTYAGLYTIQSSDGYYASATSSASTFSWKETPDATCYLKATAVTGGFQFEWWNGSGTGSYFTHSGRFGQFRSTGDPLILTPAAGSTYFTTMTCSSTFDMTFSMSSGVIDYGAGSSADYLNKADGTVISTFPTATLDGWTFIGWTAGSQYNDLYDVSGYYSDQNSSNTDPIASPAVGGAIYGGSYGGTAYTMHSDIVMYPVFTKFEDNVAFDEINGGDYYIYFLDDGNEDTYGADKRVYAATYDGEKRYTSTASCASATLFTFTKLPNGNWTIQDKTTGNYLYGIADDWLKQQASTTGAEWTLTLNGSQFDAFHVGSSYGQISANGNGNSATFQNYRRTNISDNPTVYHRVYLGSCAERIFSSNPTNTPEITLNGEAGIITSSQNGAIRGTNVLSVSGSKLTADITISSNSSDIYFSTSASSSFALAAAYQPKTEITIAKNGSGIVNPTTVYVHYKPSTNTDTWVTKTITASSTGADDQTKDVNLRIVQENFVIASKVGDTWYALPADMSSAGVYEPVLIEVDESSKVAYGPSTVAYKMWPVQTVNGGTDRYADYGDRVRFAGNSNKGLMTSAANNNIQNNAAITAIGSTAANPATYEWTLSTTDRETYTLYNANASHYLDIYRPTSGGNAGKLIWAGNDTYETNEVHFFPLTERAVITIIPREWKSNGLVFAIDADNTISLTSGHTTAKIGTGDAASATLTRHSTGGYGLYEVALPTLTSHYGKVLTLKMKIGGVDTYAYTTIPIIVTGTTTTTTAETPFTALSTASKDYDVVILDGAKLTTNATASGASSFQNFYVYSGGTWINDNGSTSFNYLELRGGIKGIGAKDSHVQGVPHVLLNKAVSSTAGANLDMTVYTDHGYALSVPFDVDLSKVNFANSLKPGTGAQVNGTLASQFWIRKYDGAERAANGKGGWVDLEPEEVDEVMVYPTIHAGEGYTLQGKRPKGQPFAVIRFPFTGVASWANASGEVAKADIPIYAHAGTATTPDNDKGWNLIANPYMATIAYNTDDELSWAAAFKVGSLTETEGDTWDGKYQWTNATQAYVTIPNDSYTAFPQTRASKATFYPFKNFFIQTASNGVVAFVRTDRHEMPRHLMAQAEQMAPIYADINLAHGEESAQAGLTIDADATAGYQFGEDYTIFESREALDYLKVYTIADEHYLVGNTLTPTEAEEMIPLEFYAPSTEGAYVFSLDDGSDIDRLEYVILYDAELGLNTNLLSDYYTVELDKTGLIENRFYIGLKIKQKDNSATGIDDVGGDPDHPFKFLYRDKLYILRGGKLYDATGKQVKEINK